MRLTLAEDANVDIDVAARAIHDAESGSRGRSGACLDRLLHCYERHAPWFLTVHGGAWVHERCRKLGAVCTRGLATLASAALRLGDTQLLTAERAARELVAAEPLSEGATALLMRALNARGERPTALVVYDRYRLRVREALGVAPEPQLLALHPELVTRRRDANGAPTGERHDPPMTRRLRRRSTSSGRCARRPNRCSRKAASSTAGASSRPPRADSSRRTERCMHTRLRSAGSCPLTSASDPPTMPSALPEPRRRRSDARGARAFRQRRYPVRNRSRQRHRVELRSRRHGPLVVFLHGFPQFHYAFRSQLRAFSADHLAVAPDQRGYNRSSKPEGVTVTGSGPRPKIYAPSSSTSGTTPSSSSATIGEASWLGHLRSITAR